MCFFHSFCSFFGKKPPCCDVLLVSVGIGVVLHVFTIVLDIFWMMWSNCEHADYHWFSLSWFNEKDWLYYLIGLHFLQRI